MTTEPGARYAVLTTRTGLRLQVRSAEPEDETTLVDMFERVDPEALRFRFLTGVPKVRPSMVEPLVRVDHRTTENFLAFADEDPIPVASAMIAIDMPNSRAEVAISVRDDHRSEGIGWTLLDHAAGFAKERGVKVLQSVESRDNRPALQLEREMGFTSQTDPQDPTLVIVSKALESD